MATKQTLVEHLTHNCGLHRASAIQAVEGIVAKISECLANGDDVQIRGFGTFRSVDVAERLAQNPNTGEIIKIPAHRTAKFKVSKEFKNSLNK